MTYLGTPPQSGFITTAKQRVTSSTNDYVDLDHSISSIADVIVFVNFVKQDTTNLTLTTSTRITLGGTLVSSDIVEIHYLGKAVNTQTPSAGTVTNDMLAGSIANSKLANSSITLNGSAVSLGGSATVGGNNTPNFRASLANSPTLGTGAEIFVTMDNEIFDSDSAYDTSTGRFTVPSGQAGVYFLQAQIRSVSSADFNMFEVQIHQNTGSIAEARHYHDHENTVSVSVLVNASVGDYFRVRAFQNAGSDKTLAENSRFTFFQGFKLI